MKKLLLLVLLLPGIASAQTGVGTLDMWKATSSPVSGITQRTYGTPLVISGLTTGLCLTLDSSKRMTTTACGAGSSTFATTSISALYPLSWNTSLAQMSTVATSSLNLTVGTFLSPNISQWTNNSNYITQSTWYGLSTTSQPSSSNILTSNGSNGVYGTATSTLTASSPFTGSFTQIGSGGALGCTTASSGVAGCLSNTAFDTFNNKQATISTTWPITLSGATVGFNGLSTSSAPSIGNLSYWTDVNTLGTVATGTVSATGPITATAGQSVIGSGLTIACTTASAGVAGCLNSSDWSTFNNKVTSVSGTYPVTITGAATTPIVELAFGTTTNNTWSGLQSFSTASTTVLNVSGTPTFQALTTGIGHLSATGVLTSSAVALGGSEVTGTLGVGNGGTGVTSFGGTNTLLYTTSANVLSSIATGNSQIFQTDSGGIPFLAATLPAFTMNGAITGNGNNIVGVGLASSTSLIVSSFGTGVLHSNDQGNISSSAVGLASADVTGVLAIANGGTNANSQTTNGVNFFNGSAVTSGTALVFTGAQLGVATSSPYATLSVGSSNPNTTMLSFTRPDNSEAMKMAISSGAPTLTLGSAAGQDANLIVNGNVGIGTTTPFGLLSVQGTRGSANQGQLIVQGNADHAYIQVGSTDTTKEVGIQFTKTNYGSPAWGIKVPGSSDDLQFADVNAGTIAMTLNGTTGNVGIGTTTPVEKLSILSSDNANTTDVFAVRSNNLVQGIGIGYNAIKKIGTGAFHDISLLSKGDSYVWLGQDTPETGYRFSPTDSANNNIYFGNRTVGLTAESGNKIHISKVSALSTGLTVDTTSGNVGIGTTTPNQKLNLYGNGGGSTVGGLLGIDLTDDPVFAWASETLAPNLTAGHNVIHMTGKESSTNNAAYFGFNYVGAGSASNFATIGLFGSDNLLNIQAGGNVGIGTTTPSKLFEVNGAIRSGIAGANANTFLTDTVNARVGINSAAPAETFVVASLVAKATASTYTTASFGSSDVSGVDNLVLLTRVGGSATQASRFTGIQSYEFGSGGGVKPLVLQDLGGNVGIGTTTPSQKLDINGSINLEGSTNGIIVHDTATANCYIIQVTNGVVTPTSHACQ